MIKLFALSIRNIKNYIRDKSAIFFSFLSVLILFFLYVLFIGKNMKAGLDNSFYYSGFNVSQESIRLFVDSWMVAGVVAIGCITVANGSLHNLVHDTTSNKYVDFYVTPTNRLTIILSYLLGTVAITFVMSLAMFLITYFYMLISGMSALPFITVLVTIGLILLSCFSASMIMLTFSLLIKSDSAYSAISTVLGVVVGFATGGYMPVSLFPKFISNFCVLIPGSSSVALIRNYYMEASFASLSETVPQNVIDNLYENYGLELHLGNWNVPEYVMVLYLILSIFVFLGIAYLIVNNRKNK